MDEIEIVDYNLLWPAEFEREARAFNLPCMGSKYWRSMTAPRWLVLHSDAWRRRLVFRDYLRAHPSDAKEYLALKLRLAKEHRSDREAYTAAKDPFVAPLPAPSDDLALFTRRRRFVDAIKLL